MCPNVGRLGLTGMTQCVSQHPREGQQRGERTQGGPLQGRYSPGVADRDPLLLVLQPAQNSPPTPAPRKEAW